MKGFSRTLMNNQIQIKSILTALFNSNWPIGSINLVNSNNWINSKIYVFVNKWVKKKEIKKVLFHSRNTYSGTKELSRWWFPKDSRSGLAFGLSATQTRHSMSKYRIEFHREIYFKARIWIEKKRKKKEYENDIEIRIRTCINLKVKFFKIIINSI